MNGLTVRSDTLAEDIVHMRHGATLIRSIGLLAVVISATCAFAVDDRPAAATTRPAMTVPHAAAPPRIDASMDDPAWQSAARISALSLSEGPQAKTLAPLPTEVALLWDAKFLYLRFTCTDADLYSPHGTARDGKHVDGDVVEVFIDPVGDGRQFIELQVNPAGGVFDANHVLTADAASGPDGVLTKDILSRDAWFMPDWDIQGLRTATAPIVRDGKPTGWIADIAIPAEPLLRRLGRKTFETGGTLRANFLRYDNGTPDAQKKSAPMIAMNWSPVAWGRPHRSPARMGTLTLSDR